MFRFVAAIYKEGMNYLVRLPGNCKDYFRMSGRIPVKGTINGVNFRSTLVPRKNETYVMFVNSEIRDRINKSDFDEIDICIRHDPESRELPVPDDVEWILSEDRKIYDAFLHLTSSQRREIIQYITQAKKAETRLKRIQQIAGYLRERIHKHE